MTAVIVPGCAPASLPSSTAGPTLASPAPEDTPALPAAEETPGKSLEEASNNRSLYEITAELSDDGASLACTQRLVYVNSSDDSLSEIVLNVYPNAFLSEDAVTEEEFPSVFNEKFSEGGIDFESVSENGEPADSAYINEEKTQLRVPLREELKPQKSAELLLEYTVRLPRANYRFGIGDTATMLGNCFPIAAVYEDGWRMDPYYPIGDPFYSEVSDYKLSVRLPEGYLAAGTGNSVMNASPDGQVEYSFEASCVRDFALAFSDKYSEATVSNEKYEVRSFADSEENAHFAADIALDALEIYSGIFGDLPYESVSVVQSDIGGGMEFPCLIMIGKGCYTGTGRQFGETCIAHEIAHQWWYSAVGSDQIKTPWADEGLAEYLGFLYWREQHGAGAFETAWNSAIGPAQEDLELPVGASIYKFNNWRDYANVIYYQGARMFKALHEKLGDDVFFEALKQYYEDYCYLNAGEEDLAEAFSKAAGENLEPFFLEWGVDLT
jgi:hypothetical protein